VTLSGRRNLSLVAGALGHLNLLGTNSPGIGQMYLPEPTTAASLLTGACALLLVGAWRARRSR